ncbi:MAG: sugar transferase [Propionibacteriaceae bacterium]|nr:sugar transferase [Propionibacteriaceae bacterium]
MLIVDTTLITLATIAAAGLREWAPFMKDSGSEISRLVVPLMPGIVVAWMAALLLADVYRQRHWGAGVEEYREVINTSVTYLMAVGLLAFLFNYPLSRGFLAFLLIIGVPLLFLGRIVARRLLHALRRRGQSVIRTMVVGNQDAVTDVLEVLRREPWLGYSPIGIVINDDAELSELEEIPILGSADSITELITEHKIGAVIFSAGSVRRGNEFNALARKLEKQHVEMVVAPAMTDIAAQRISVSPVAGIPLMHVERPRAEKALTTTKRSFDVALTCLILIVASPLLLVTALLVKLEDGGPVLFKQWRVGRGGKLFELYKFRSMVVDAERIRAEQLEDKNESDGALFKMKKDPRVTRIGGFIRRFSIDELPQLFNVLKGEMSLIGPRPALEDEVKQYKSHVRRRLDVRPGLTGLWQVSGRSDLSWDDAVRLDLYYVDNWSMVQDISILVRTVRAVLSSRGAY